MCDEMKNPSSDNVWFRPRLRNPHVPLHHCLLFQTEISTTWCRFLLAEPFQYHRRRERWDRPLITSSLSLPPSPRLPRIILPDDPAFARDNGLSFPKFFVRLSKRFSWQQVSKPVQPSSPSPSGTQVLSTPLSPFSIIGINFFYNLPVFLYFVYGHWKLKNGKWSV